MKAPPDCSFQLPNPLLLPLASIFQPPNSKGIQLGIGTENRQMMLDGLSGNDAVKGIPMVCGEPASAKGRGCVN